MSALPGDLGANTNVRRGTSHRHGSRSQELQIYRPL